MEIARLGWIGGDEYALAYLRHTGKWQDCLSVALDRGEATSVSDIDVIIVSDFFKGIRFVKRMGVVLKKIRFSRHVDFICYTPEEFEEIRNSSIIVKEALLEGIAV